MHTIARSLNPEYSLNGRYFKGLFVEKVVYYLASKGTVVVRGVVDAYLKPIIE